MNINLSGFQKTDNTTENVQTLNYELSLVLISKV